MKKWYGNLTNRIEEGKNYNSDKLIHVGDDITMYYYSDRTCYFVTEVIDQEHIKVARYNVVADREKANGMGHQDWLYFKTVADEKEYLNKYFDKKEIEDEDYELSESEWKIHRGKWCEVRKYNLEVIEKIKEACGWFNYSVLTEKQLEKINNGAEVVKYSPINNISFGVKDYYYDWEF